MMPHRKEWMSEDQWWCWQMLARVRKGFHHIYAEPREFGNGIKVNVHYSLSTYDFDVLTRLVVAAHQWCVRVEITHSGPRMVGIVMHRRKTREGSMMDRHPAIYEAVDEMVSEIRCGPSE